MTTIPRRRSLRVAAVLVASFIVACESSDKIPPEGSTVTVGANPATIPLSTRPECLVLLNVTDCGKADIVATVASKMGVPLPDQDVRFSSTAGFLFTGPISNPTGAANLPIRTDKFGNATVSLATATTATVTAKSGAASGTLSITTVAGNLSTILLNLDTTSTGCSGSTTTVTSCSQTVCVSATALDSTGAGIAGVPIFFDLQNNVVSGNTFNGVFTPSQTITNTSGKAFATFTPDSTCPAQCGAKQCQGEMIATTQGGAFPSTPLQLQINIP
jgi:hypothetical protein